MKAPIYRQEALDHAKAPGFGIPMKLPRSQRVAAKVALLTVGGLCAWICVGSYTRRTTVQGALEPHAGLSLVRPPRAGKVLKIHVSQGEHVNAGTPLFTLTADQQTEQHAITSQRGQNSLRTTGLASEKNSRLSEVRLISKSAP